MIWTKDILYKSYCNIDECIDLNMDSVRTSVAERNALDKDSDSFESDRDDLELLIVNTCLSELKYVVRVLNYAGYKADSRTSDVTYLNFLYEIFKELVLTVREVTQVEDILEIFGGKYGA